MDRTTAKALTEAGYMTTAEYIRLYEGDQMPQIHEVKSWPEFYAALEKGQPFDLRDNNRRYKVGDTIVFKEYDDRLGKLTGKKLTKRITHVMENSIGSGAITPMVGLHRGYAIIGLADIG